MPRLAGLSGLTRTRARVSSPLPSPLPRRALHVSAHTILHPTPQAVESHIAGLGLSPRSVVLFSLCTSLPGDALSPLLAPLAGLDAVGAFHAAASAPTSLATTSSSSSAPSLAIAAFTPEQHETVSTWYVSETGRGPAEVGRWHRVGTDWMADTRGDTVGELEAALEKGGWDSLWAPEDKGVVLGDGRDTDRATAVVALTDGTPHPVLAAMDAYPNAVKLGIMSAPTPFLTGRPHTLFHKGQPYSVGSVGLVFSGMPAPAVETEYGVEALDKEYVVERCRGNLLLSMEGAPNPTQTLILALQRRDVGRPASLTKDEDFYLAITDPKSDGNTTTQDQRRIVRILSGDPSRGSLGVDTEMSLLPGQTVQFMQRTRNRTTAPPAARRTSSSSLTFSVLPRADEADWSAPPEETGEPVTLDGFMVASEGGMVYAPPGGTTSVCAVADATVSVEWA